MKKNTIVGIALAMGMLSFGAVTASAAGSCCTGSNCADQQVVQKFNREAAGLTNALKAKDIELRELYGYEGMDIGKAAALEAELKEIKGRIKVVAEKYNILPCCLS